MSLVLDTVLEYIREALEQAPTTEDADSLREEIIHALQRDQNDATLGRISRHIRAVFPTAATLRAVGEWNEDMLLRLYPRELLDADGASLASSDDPSQEWVDVFEADDTMDQDLMELAESNPEYEGDTEIALRTLE